MYLVVAHEFLESLQVSPLPWGELTGESQDEHTVVQLIGQGQKRLGYWMQAEKLPEKAALPSRLAEDLKPGDLLALLSPEPLFYLVSQENGLLPQPYTLMQTYTDFHSRLEGLFDTAALRQKKVAVVGLGTGGSLIAVELAKAGVGNFKLVDFDRLEIHNLARHVCGLRDLGRLKVAAMRDYLLNVSPMVQIETHDFDVTTDMSRLTEILQGCNLLVGATDSEGAKDLLNRVAWQLGVPAVYGAAYNLGFGGDVFVADPPAGPCYQCFRNATGDMFQSEGEKPEVSYDKIVPQPALGMDVGMVGLITARVALTVLLKADPSARLGGFPTNWILWGNQVWPGWIFDKPLQSEFFEIEPDPLCPVCHSEAYTQSQLGMSAAEAQVKATVLINQLKASAANKPTEE